MLREQQLKEEREQRRRDAAIGIQLFIKYFILFCQFFLILIFFFIFFFFFFFFFFFAAADAQSFVRLSQSAAYSTYAYPSRARRPTGQAAIQSAGAVTTEKKSSSAPVASSSVVSLNEIKTASSASGNTSSAKQIAGNDAQPEVKPASRSTQPSASHSTFVRSLRTPSPTRASPSAPSAVNSVPASSLNVPSSQQKQLQYLSKLQKAAASLLGPAHVEWMTKPIVQNVKPARPSSAAARMKF
jgi:hypothetical protein